MKKLVAVLGIVIVLLSSVCGILCYQLGYQISDMQSQNSALQNQLSQLENQTSELGKQLDDLEDENIQRRASDASQVKITGMSMHYTQMPGSPIDVTVKNFGASDVDGLNLILTTNAGDNHSITVPIGFIYGGEEKTVNKGMYHTFYQESDTIFAALMLGENILDTDELRWR